MIGQGSESALRILIKIAHRTDTKSVSISLCIHRHSDGIQFVLQTLCFTKTVDEKFVLLLLKLIASGHNRDFA